MIRIIPVIFLLPSLLFSQYIPKIRFTVAPWVQNCLVKDSSVRDYYKVSPFTGISVYATPEDKKKDKPEFNVSPQEFLLAKAYFENQPFDSCWKLFCSGAHVFNSPAPQLRLPVDDLKPLAGLRIALDPGHIAGDYPTARLERKSVQIKKDSLKGIYQHDTIIEGKLTLATALLLKKKLEDAGATVFITREKDNFSAFGKDYDSWVKEDMKRCLDSAVSRGHISPREKTIYTTKPQRKVIFREFFLQEDLRERARRINAFNPDLTIIIHYNVDEKNEGWTKPTKKNFCMAFIPGAFMGGRMEKKEARFNLFRLLLTDDLAASAVMAGLLCEQFQNDLNVSLAGPEDAAYLKESCTQAPPPQKGVYCRNLALTRLISGPVVYGESLYQDNLDEYKNLSIKNFKDGKTPDRVVKVAEAYYKAILAYFLNN